MKLKKLTALVIGSFLIFSLFLLSVGSNISIAKPIQLKVATWLPAHIDPSRIVSEWAKMVEERSNGKVKFVFFWASSLAKMEDTFRATQTGLADMGMWTIGNVSGLTPLNEYISLPFLGFKDTPTVLKVFKEMWNTRPELSAEFKDMMYLYGYPMPPYHLHMTEKTIRAPNDIKGLKILADASSTDFLNSLGAVSVVKGPPDWYMSLQKGLVEGFMNHWAVVRAYKLEELFKGHFEMGKAGVNSMILSWWFNQDSWDKLPPETQKVIMELQPEFEQKSLELSLTLQKLGREIALTAGHEINELSPEEVDQWIKAAEPVHKKWVEDLESKGKPGIAVYEKAIQLITRFNEE